MEARKLVDEATVTDDAATIQALNQTGYDETARYVYGMTYGDWKKRHQQKATDEQMQLYESSKPLHAVHDKELLAKRSTTSGSSSSSSSSGTNAPLLSNVCCQNVDDSNINNNNNKISSNRTLQAALLFQPPPWPTSLPVPLKMAVLTVSDRASAGTYQDFSGPAVVQAVQAIYNDKLEITPVVVVPDQIEAIQSQLKSWAANDGSHHHIILTTGGTGWSSRDVSPEATRGILDQECSGLMAFVTTECSRLHQPLSSLSRGTAGVLGGKTLVANLPGNPAGVKEMVPILFPLLLHAVADLEQSSLV